MKNQIQTSSTQLTQTLLKAQSLTIKPSYKSKSSVQHYSLIFENIPYYTKDHRLLYSEMILPDCTLDIEALAALAQSSFKENKLNKKNKNNIVLTIPNLQSFLFKNKLNIQLHPESSTTTLLTLYIDEAWHYIKYVYNIF